MSKLFGIVKLRMLCFLQNCATCTFANAAVSSLICRDLVKEGFPLHDEYIPKLLESIGDHEQDIVETVLFAVANAR